MGSAAQEPTEAPPKEEFSAVLMRSVDVHGEVYILSERDDSTQVPARRIHIQVRDIETGETLAETQTDNNGVYQLPKLDVGLYHLVIGALRLNVRIIPEEEGGNDLSKVIIVIIPEEMASARGAKK